MSILTNFFNLIKPTKGERFKISDFNSNMDIIDTEMHRPPLTVNGIAADQTTRDIQLKSVPLADNLSSDETQFSVGDYLIRTSGGGAPISDGKASLSTVKGNNIKTGYVAESLEMTVNAVQRTAPAAITATLDAATFEAYVESGGIYTLTYTTSWSADPSLYGVTVTNTPVSGDQIVIVWDGESTPAMEVRAVTRPVPAAITATINRNTFVSYVTSSGTVTLTYSSGWSADPANYGITVYNTPVSGDEIVVVYVKENRGTITPAKITKFNSTGWNLYNNTNGYAYVPKYSETYGFKIGGTYSLVSFATTPTGTTTAISVQNGYFNVPSDGYVIVTGGDATTYIYATWSDWTEGYSGDFESYSVDTVDLTSIMANFANGLFSVGDVRDEINFNTQKAISRIDRLAYNDTNLAAVIASGLPYDTDTNYIYAVRETAVEYSFSLSGEYDVSDHGTEYFTATTTTPPVTETIYGDNLKDKLRTDVLTISQQTLTTAQKNQVKTNIGIVNMTGATSGAAGASGLVPAPSAGANGKFLRGDGTWNNPANMTGASGSAAGSAGMVPAPAIGDNSKFLGGDGTWKVPADTWRGKKRIGFSYTYSLANNTTLDITATQLQLAAPEGYEPTGAYSVVTGDSGVILVGYRLNVSGSEWAMRIRNVSGASLSNKSVYIGVEFTQKDPT